MSSELPMILTIASACLSIIKQYRRLPVFQDQERIRLGDSQQLFLCRVESVIGKLKLTCSCSSSHEEWQLASWDEGDFPPSLTGLGFHVILEMHCVPHGETGANIDNT